MISPLILNSILIIGLFGVIGGLILALAAKYLAVQEDPRIEQVTQLLPGVNCGGCGYAGCADYARAIIAHNTHTNLCAPGGNDTAQKIAAFLGTTAETLEPTTALVHCHGTFEKANRKYQYNGIADCTSAATVGGGSKSCVYGCLGYGNCARVCPVRAIDVTEGLATVNKERCIACGRCVAACPRKIIHIVPAAPTLRVFCSSRDKGPQVRNYCKVGCIGCKICTKFAGDSIVVEDNLARRDYAHPCPNDDAAAKCPVKCISTY